MDRAQLSSPPLPCPPLPSLPFSLFDCSYFIANHTPILHPTPKPWSSELDFLGNHSCMKHLSLLTLHPPPSLTRHIHFLKDWGIQESRAEHGTLISLGLFLNIRARVPHPHLCLWTPLLSEVVFFVHLLFPPRVPIILLPHSPGQSLREWLFFFYISCKPYGGIFLQCVFISRK